MSSSPGETILKDDLTLDSLREKIAENDTTADDVKGRVLEAKKALGPIRSLMTEFFAMIANLESMNSKTSQEKFLTVRMKLIELQNDIQKFSKEYQQLQPLIGTMEKFNEELGVNEKRFFVQENLGYVQVPSHTMPGSGTSKTSGSDTYSNNTTATATSSSSNSKSKKSAPGKSSAANAPTSQPPASRRNPPKKTAAATSTTPAASNMNITANTPNLKQMPVAQPMQLLPGVSPMAVASPLNNISPQRRMSALVNQSRENSMHQSNATPAVSTITPQNILNMSSFDLPQNQTPQTLDNVNMDLNNLDLDSLNMDFLN